MRVSVLVAFAALLSSSFARAEGDKPGGEEGPRARWHPKYVAEIEGHGEIAAFDKYFVGLGGGVRVAVPIWEHAPFKRIDDTFGFGVGLDIIRYGAYHPQGSQRGPVIGAVAYHVPLYAQWNIWFSSRASIFLEPGFLWRFASYTDSCVVASGCASPTAFFPTISAGIRFRVVDHASIDIRVGGPPGVVSLGGSWL